MPRPLPASYLRALLRGRRVRDTSGFTGLDAPPAPVRADPRRLAAYARVCGFPSAAGTAAEAPSLPPTYPHVLAFPAAMDLMTRPGFPLPLLGLVHVHNTIRVLRPIAAAEALTVRVGAGNLAAHPAGTAIDVLAEVRDGYGFLAWQSTSTYLRRDRRAARSPRQASEHQDELSGLDDAATWLVPANTGRRYAAVSGDRNPIHLHPYTARLFGFPTAIAHGMWAVARVLAELGPSLPPAYDVDVAFRAPIRLPSAVRLRTDHTAPDHTALDHAAPEGGTRFALASGDGSRVHLTGSVALPTELTRQ
jgi:acyl dehydratase